MLRTMVAVLAIFIAVPCAAEVQWDPAASTHDGTAFVSLQPGIGVVSLGFPSAANPVGAGATVSGVYAFGFANTTPGPSGPTINQTDLSASALVAGTELVLQFSKSADDHVSFIAMLADAENPADIGYKLLSSTRFEIRAKIVDPILSESNDPDALGAAFGLIVHTVPTLDEAFNLRGTVFVTDMHWLDLDPPDFSELPQGSDDINGMAAGIAAKGISAVSGQGQASFSAYMPEDFFEFARANGVDVSGASCLGYRAYVELTGSDDGFYKLNDPDDLPYDDAGFDSDGDGVADPIWRYRIVNGTWSRQLLSFGKIGAATANPADFDGSGSVDFQDFVAFAVNFGKVAADTDFDARYDLSGNGAIDFLDFVSFAADFGS